MPHKTKEAAKAWRDKRFADPARRKARHIYNTRWFKDHPDYQADGRLRRLYGLSLEEKQELCNQQKGKCANVNCTYLFKSLADAKVDHNHSTGKVRELLCSHCNTALGLLDENADKLEGLKQYIRKHN